MKFIEYSKPFFLTVLVCVAFRGSAQNKPIQQNEMQRKRLERNYYRKMLQIDSVKADQVAQIQEEYKSKLKSVLADTGLNETAKRVRIKGLMEAKNQRYKTLLSPTQQLYIIPSTERPIDKKL